MTYLKSLKDHLRAATLLISFCCTTSIYAQKTIGITQIVDHPSLNEIRKGIMEGLAQEGFVEGKDITIIFETAQGNQTTAVQIAQKFASLPLDAIIPISTPSAQPIVQQVKKTPIIFAAISDPISAKVVSSLQHPGGNVTGVADIPPLEQQLSFIENCIPHLKTLGVVYNPGETNNVSFLEKLKAIAKKKHIKIVTASALKSADVQEAAHSLIADVDAIFIGNDNTVVSGLEALIKVSLEGHKPLFVSDPQSVNRGALAAYAYDQNQIGQQVGKMVAQVLQGNNPGDMPVQQPTGLKMSINPQTAAKLKITCSLSSEPEEGL